MASLTFKRAILVACLVPLTFARRMHFRSDFGAQSGELVEHETRTDIVPGFVDSGPANQDTVIRMRVALVSSNMSGLEGELYAVSDPKSARYGQHLTKAQVEDFVKPSEDTLAIVTQWLTSNGISPQSASPASDLLDFLIPIGKANSLLNADYHTFVHTETGEQSTTTMSYSIPANLKGHLDFVHPGITFSSSSGNRPTPSLFDGNRPISSSSASMDVVSTSMSADANSSKSSIPHLCNITIIPECLVDLYGLPTDLPDQPKNVLGVAGLNLQYANKVDLGNFLRLYRPNFENKTFDVVSVQSLVGNPEFAKLAGIEATLDIQYTVGVATGANVTFYTVGLEHGINIADNLITLMDFLLAQDELPTVLSSSYGFNERVFSPALANQLCNAIMQLGARGTSVLFSSGDGGVGGFHPVNCTTFVPTFPSGCPFLTSVGGTQGLNETAAVIGGPFFSSGGFSNIFPVPSYQSSAVASYLDTLSSSSTPNTGLFNTTGRGYPDVSAQAVNFEIIFEGLQSIISGTSASAPVFSSVISMLNSELITAGKSPLGFLNPLLYQNPAALNDVLTGDNPGCGTKGFPAAAGWDPVTGLGTPNYPKLKALAGL